LNGKGKKKKNGEERSRVGGEGVDQKGVESEQVTGL